MPLYNPAVVVSTAIISNTSNRLTVPVPLDITNAEVLAEVNLARKGLTIANVSVGNILIDVGAEPTATNYMARIVPGGYFELPYNFTGAIYGLWDAAGGTGADIREFI